MPAKTDPNHNEWLNTEKMLRESFAKTMQERGVSVDSSDLAERGQPSRQPTGDFFITTRQQGKSRGTKRVLVKQASAGGTEEQTADAPVAAPVPVSADMERLAGHLDAAKTNMIELFDRIKDDQGMSVLVHKAIKSVEEAQLDCGQEVVQFEPLRRMSGLAIPTDLLANANKVVTTTLKSYGLYPITEAMSCDVEGLPHVVFTIVGQKGEMGFTVRAAITRRGGGDFIGNEAIDYVYAPGGGLLTVKALDKGRWVDVTDNYHVRAKHQEEPIPKNIKFGTALYVGRKIVETGKGNIQKSLNLSSDDVEFGQSTVHVKDQTTLESVKELIRARCP